MGFSMPKAAFKIISGFYSIKQENYLIGIIRTINYA